jgi:hypothetical protein
VVESCRTFYNAISRFWKKISPIWPSASRDRRARGREYLAAAEAIFIMLLGKGLKGMPPSEPLGYQLCGQMPRQARLVRDGEEVEVDAATSVRRT